MKSINSFSDQKLDYNQMSNSVGGKRISDYYYGQDATGYYIYWLDDEEGYVGAYLDQFA